MKIRKDTECDLERNCGQLELLVMIWVWRYLHHMLVYSAYCVVGQSIIDYKIKQSRTD